MAAILALLLAGFVAAGTGLEQARSEPNLEKRSKLALDNADQAFEAARAAYRGGDLNQTSAQAKEVEDSVNLAYASLVATGKNPRKSPKWFKHAEKETRELGRRLDDFQREMSFNDRPVLDKVKARVQRVHEDLLMGLMEGRKEK